MKEVFETVEVFHRVHRFVAHQKKTADLVLYDLACGHGLMGILLAIRFPKAKVVCTDRERRPAFDAVAEEAAGAGLLTVEKIKSGQQEERRKDYGNLSFVEQDIADFNLAYLKNYGQDSATSTQSACADQGEARSAFLVCIHGCNGVNKLVLDTAKLAQEDRENRTARCLDDVDMTVSVGWAVMPCCIPNGLYFPGKVGGLQTDDSFCYALKCGFIAGRYGAQRMDTIDSRITNRNSLLLRGF
jgi:hypothetical protein